MPLTRVGRNGFVRTNCVLSRDARLPCNKPPTNNSGGEYDIIRVIYFHSNKFQPSTGLVMAVFKPASPAVLPNPQNVLEGMIATKCSIGAVVPAFIEVTWLIPCLFAFHSR